MARLRAEISKGLSLNGKSNEGLRLVLKGDIVSSTSQLSDGGDLSGRRLCPGGGEGGGGDEAKGEGGGGKTLHSGSPVSADS